MNDIKESFIYPNCSLDKATRRFLNIIRNSYINPQLTIIKNQE